MHKKSGHIHIEAEINTKRNKTKKNEKGHSNSNEKGIDSNHVYFLKGLSIWFWPVKLWGCKNTRHV
jgi:hypothetical protein